MVKKILKRIAQLLLAALLAIQFFRPAKNIAAGPAAYAKDISTAHAIPADVQLVFQKACYDCHSNNTTYPWYSYVQPVTWWLQHHVDEGKAELNFSEFAGYSLRRQYRKLEEINKEVKEGEMPLSSYTLIHSGAKLTATEKLAIANWATALRDSMQQVYPLDSLIKKKQ